MRPSGRLLVLAVWAASLVSAAPSPAPVALFPNETHRLLVDGLRQRLAEVAEIEAEFNGGITTTDGTFSEMGKVDYILSHSRRFPRRYLHENDHDFVFSAVRGQPTPELERNLAAVVHYVRLATASRWYNYRARHNLPLVGRRQGLDKVTAIAKRVFDFRNRQLQRIESGELRPSQAISRAELGDLGRPELLAELESAFDAGQQQFTNQRNAVVLAVFAVEIGISFLIAVLFLRRARPFVVVHERA